METTNLEIKEEAMNAKAPLCGDDCPEFIFDPDADDSTVTVLRFEYAHLIKAETQLELLKKARRKRKDSWELGIIMSLILDDDLEDDDNA